MSELALFAVWVFALGFASGGLFVNATTRRQFKQLTQVADSALAGWEQCSADYKAIALQSSSPDARRDSGQSAIESPAKETP